MLKHGFPKISAQIVPGMECTEYQDWVCIVYQRWEEHGVSTEFYGWDEYEVPMID